ncbi:Ig-like domain-containing protein [Sanguibacter suarezii]|uniref:Ig-like domain-containing protein n=1 Tax=Sanguibacter suarezii TaxID=60921 RepID=UPI00146FFFC4|nr:Ig-like domain-containing protein [Sanguibacter suarezii]
MDVATPQPDEARHGVHAGVEEGFSLIEVVVALFLIGIVAAGALLFFVRGAQNASHLQRTQAASTIATQGMELVRSIDPRPATPAATSGLLTGRSKADVQAVWAAADPQDTAQTVATWDAITPQSGHANDSLPQVRETTASGMDYTITTLIGTCYRPAAASVGRQSCTAANLVGSVQMYRATVVVTWAAGKADQCDSGRCTYRLSALIDPSTDASWNLSTKPVAYDDAAKFSAGDPLTMIDVLANDVISTVTSNPTTILTAPAYGTAVVVSSGLKMGAINYTAPTNYSGPVELTYKLRDVQGRNSNEATVRIAVLPKAVNDTATVARGGTVVIPAVANDLGTGLVPSITTPPAGSFGTATVVGSDIRFIASASAPLTSTTLKYTVIDASAQNSLLEATITISVTAPIVSATDVVVDIPATMTPGQTTLAIGPAGYKVFPMTPVVAVGTTPAASVGTLTGAGSTAMKYQPKAGTVGVYAFTFQLEDATGTRSATKTATIRVTPVAKAYTHTPTITRTDKQTITVIGAGLTNIPNAKTTGITYAVASPPVCVSEGPAPSKTVRTPAIVTVASDTGLGAFEFTRPVWSGTQSATCTFGYTVTMTYGSQPFTTPVATATVKVQQ